MAAALKTKIYAIGVGRRGAIATAGAGAAADGNAVCARGAAWRRPQAISSASVRRDDR